MMLLTWNNLAYYQELMAGLRKAIAEGRLDDHIAEVKEGWARGESGGTAEPAIHADNSAPVAGIE
jgi:queuine tRNA-ribosyltransferase